MGFFKKLWGNAKRGVKKAVKTGLKIGKTLYKNRNKILKVAHTGLKIGEGLAAMIPGEGTAIAGALEVASQGVDRLERGVKKSEQVVHMGDNALKALKVGHKRKEQPSILPAPTTAAPSLQSYSDTTNQSIEKKPETTSKSDETNLSVTLGGGVHNRKRRRVNRI